MTDRIEKAAEVITRADAILIGAGAGMGVDSGLPDFRGNEGFWKAYPPMKSLGLSFYDLANPVWFAEDPQRAWGFYGHRRNLYSETEPHRGFEILKKWCDSKRNQCFVFTSNVDGHFQKSGFAESSVVECHGSVHFDQCTDPCCDAIWETDFGHVQVDLATFRASLDVPLCKYCSRTSRPNILMFSDAHWVSNRTDLQIQSYQSWLTENLEADAKLAVIELGAGTAVPTVRYQCDQIARHFATSVIRINPREAFGRNAISLECGALEALEKIDLLVD